MSIVEEIYNGQYQPQAGGPVFPRDMREEDLAFWKKVTEALGDDFADAHLRRMCKKEGLACLYHFREGFRLGVRLMLDAMSP